MEPARSRRPRGPRAVSGWLAQPGRVERLGPLAVGTTIVSLAIGLALGMAVATWLRWPDAVIDFGRELYVPWRLVSGEVLYRDIAYINGPLSPYLNAALFRIVGESVLALCLANLLVIGAITALLYRLARRMSRPLVAAAAALVFIAVFAFAQYLRVGCYNYVTPYAHETTHGLILALIALTLLVAHGEGGGRPSLAGAGVGLGLVFLTKPEIFLAAALAGAVGFLGAMIIRRPAPGRALGDLGLFLGGAAAPPLLATLLLATAMPADQALGATAGGWRTVFDRQFTSLIFYRRRMGVDDPGENLWQMLMWLFRYAAVIAPALILATLPISSRRWKIALILATFLVTLVLLAVQDIAWLEATRPLPLLLSAGAVAALIDLVRHRRGKAAGACLARAVFLVFAAALTAKMLLALRVGHYGFVLAMPATIVLVVAALDWIPSWVDARQGSGAVVRAAAAAAILAGTLALTGTTLRLAAARTEPLGAGADTILIAPDRMSTWLNKLLARLEERMAPGQTLAVVPEGTMVNYLLRRVNPTPYVSLLPSDLIISDEEAVIAAWAEHSPDMVVLDDRHTWEFDGSYAFGVGYGEDLAGWIDARYRPVERIGRFRILEPRDRGLAPSGETTAP